jgi:fumarate hydratase class II
LEIPENEPGSSIMPGKVNPTQAEALTMIAVQVMANDVAVGFSGAGGYLEMNVYKPLMIFNITHSITIMTDGCTNFRKFLVEGPKPIVPGTRSKSAEENGTPVAGSYGHVLPEFAAGNSVPGPGGSST